MAQATISKAESFHADIGLTTLFRLLDALGLEVSLVPKGEDDDAGEDDEQT